MILHPHVLGEVFDCHSCGGQGSVLLARDAAKAPPPYTPPIVLSCPNLTVLPLRHLDLGDKEGGSHRASKILAMYKGGHFIYIP